VNEISKNRLDSAFKLSSGRELVPIVEPVAKIDVLNMQGLLESCGRVLGNMRGEIVQRITRDEIVIQITKG